MQEQNLKNPKKTGAVKKQPLFSCKRLYDHLHAGQSSDLQMEHRDAVLHLLYGAVFFTAPFLYDYK
ncbi:MAG: hypothetical protein II468_04340, partial [Lachnospiraceae bacterium]|nr:hypothetical protein [Lachnospiraceae bacterium]